MHARTHARTHERTHRRTHTCTQSHNHARARTRICMCAYTRTHTHTFTRTYHIHVSCRANDLEEELHAERHVVAELRREAAAGAAAVEAAQVLLDSDGTLCGPESSVFELREEIHRVEATLEKLYALLRTATGEAKGGVRGGIGRGLPIDDATTALSKLGRSGDSGVCGSDRTTSPEETVGTGGHEPGFALRAELEESVRSAGERLGDALRELDEVHERVGEWEALANELEEGLEAAQSQLEAEAAARFELRDQLDELHAEVRRLQEVLAEAEARADAAGAESMKGDTVEHHHDPTADGPTTDEDLLRPDEIARLLPKSSLAQEIAAESSNTLAATNGMISEAPGACDAHAHACEDAAPARAKHGLSVPDNLIDLVYGDGASSHGVLSPAVNHELSVSSMDGCNSLQNTPLAMRGPLFGEYTLVPVAHSTPSSAVGVDSGERAMGVSPLLITPLKTTDNLELSPVIDCREGDRTLSAQASRADEWSSMANAGTSKRFAVARYDFDPADVDSELLASNGEHLKIVRGVVNEAWWLMENMRGAQGFVPRDYLDPCDAVLARAVGEVRKRVVGTPAQVEVWFARFDYAAKDEKQVSLLKGERVDIVSRPADKKWWVVRTIAGNVTGFAPCSYLEARLQERAPPRPILAPQHVHQLSYCKDNNRSEEDSHDAVDVTQGSQDCTSKPQVRRQAIRKRMAWLTQKPSTVDMGCRCDAEEPPDVDFLRRESASSTAAGAQKRSGGGMWKSLAVKGFTSTRTRQVLSSAKDKLLKNGQWFSK
jgi:hypothetical protein